MQYSRALVISYLYPLNRTCTWSQLVRSTTARCSPFIHNTMGTRRERKWNAAANKYSMLPWIICSDRRSVCWEHSYLCVHWPLVTQIEIALITLNHCWSDHSGLGFSAYYSPRNVGCSYNQLSFKSIPIDHTLWHFSSLKYMAHMEWNMSVENSCVQLSHYWSFSWKSVMIARIQRKILAYNCMKIENAASLR